MDLTVIQALAHLAQIIVKFALKATALNAKQGIIFNILGIQPVELVILLMDTMLLVGNANLVAISAKLALIAIIANLALLLINITCM